MTRRVESRGVLGTAHRLMNYCGNIYRYAVATGRAERDISSDLRGALPPSTPQHHASVSDPEGVAALLRAIDGYRGSDVTRYALQLAPLVFVRPGELRKAEWNEIDLEAGEWRFSAERMKMKTKYIVPLSNPAVGILRALQPLTGKAHYVFPGARSPRLGNDRARVSQHGVHPAQRTGMESGCHRAPARTYGAKLEPRGLQLCGASTGAPQDDAGMVGLLGRSERRPDAGARKAA